MLKNKAGWVALIVLAIATVLMVFFVMPNLSGIKDTPVAGTPDVTDAKPADTAAADAKGARPSATAETAEMPADPSVQPATDAKPAETAAVDPTVGWAVPGFDVLRVEPDGSTVIAGSAQPGTKLDIMNGDTVIASTEVGQSGDFAAVFDKPLSAGDYQLTLRSVGDGGASKSSEEVATVSIPKDASGELLAMVSKPGEASRILTTPESMVAASAQAGGDAQPAGTTATETAGATASSDADPASMAQTAPASDTTAADAAAADTTAAATDGANGQAAKAAADATPSEAIVASPAEATTATASDTAAATTPAATTMAGKAEVAVSAVEIEGRKVFVAGRAKPGALVRIYADDILVGEMKADEQGRFVVDGTLDLAVGKHTIRADMLSADGSKVDVRASVPFDRPEGEQVAAVAQSGAAGTMAAFDGGSFDGLRLEAGKALSLLKGLFEGGKVPSAEQLAAARSATEIALNSLADFKVAGTLDETIADMATRTSAAAAEALVMLKAVPQDAASVSAALGKIETAVGSALMPRTDGTGAAADSNAATAASPAQDTATQTPADSATQPPTTEAAQTTQPAAGTDTAAGGQAVEGPAVEGQTVEGQATDGAASSTTTTTASGGQSASEPETVEQAPLQQSKTSVIIRRGDTLWQISRRVYGAGVRYTTIYLANEDQITDPNRILPGQVFGVPDQAMSEQESEVVHRKHLQQAP
ncbi:LysM peptidoglycan-binding domain-containing protein [Pararhizobium antarcticum]|uniref:Peptidoglycan-binding protein LysM n=1 Tax=Pararhizobium antarcticum TaxID=1798805 RepID=A0A657LXD9_9HYPH|nr:LysM peptidoglycan-binding domain-containing protein [Pararhizobium antarcticum]OJF94495.1 peptidoglycan-binding protein LysM [Rhizobium sp. 58]OJG00691.1 peptidoglycan-binding protein LysM [Pararhizobium antarcticum]